MHQRDWRYTEMRPPRGAPSPWQKRGIGKAWHAPTVSDFLAALRWRSRFGEVYAVTGDHERADIIVPAVGSARSGWVIAWTYPATGLLALRDSGLLPMVSVAGIPRAGIPDAALQGLEERQGDDPAYWLLKCPGVVTEQ